MRVELVYFAGCPSAQEARQRLREAFEAVGLDASWEEWDVLDARTPVHYQRFGSPSVLVNGADVAGAEASSGIRCVVGGGPDTGAIAAALQVAQKRDPSPAR